MIGGIAIHTGHIDALLARLASARVAYPKFASEEVKWSKVGRAVLPYYKEYAGTFFGAAAEGWLDFTGLVVERRTFDHKRFNQSDPDIGFNKMVYQLLLHKVGMRFGASHKIMVVLDKRSGSTDPDELRPMLNFDLRRRGVDNFPFRRIELRDSKLCPIIQLNDLLIGAFGSHMNPDKARSKHKLQLEDFVVSQAKATCHPASIWGLNASAFRMWSFKFRG